ncbi:phosphate ABC transporter substrate-binding protein [Acetivibrio sp. MSJd-27]|jgi:phosphate binding protein|uniref:phosphate ABC transporter substrate-binding protein n=1 Tax=Acetivibrio sp. MSJd-27 TaxID=2841523 RepID=UPI0015AE19C2|nr:phosphate ABC transporter substrate-binding protein [Acetivibrio sp. MSJd-27]MBU5450595.1 phosphate ABC transporter substrate-binding protein [Acetivibrio sp. MSJd-27]
MLKKLIGISLLGAAVLLTSCGDNGSTASGTTPTSTAATSDAASKIEVVGSTSVSPLIEKMAAEYNKTDANTKINIQAVGSSAGIKAAQDGTAQIGMSSRELKDSEKAQLTETKIAIDPIAVVTNPANGVENLTKDQIIGIFKGEIKNWKEVGGTDKPIVVVIREAGSGTRDAFEEIMKLTSEKDGKKISLVAQDAITADSNGAVKQNIATKENAIGYLSFGVVDDTVKGLSVDGVKPSTENVKNDTYLIKRPFLLVCKGEYDAAAKKFVDFIMSDAGQKMVEADGYISAK